MPASIADTVLLPSNPVAQVSATDPTPISPGDTVPPLAFGRMMAVLAAGVQSPAGTAPLPTVSGPTSQGQSVKPVEPASQSRPARTPPSRQPHSAATSSDAPEHGNAPHPVEPNAVPIDALQLALPVDNAPPVLRHDTQLRTADAVTGIAADIGKETGTPGPAHVAFSNPEPPGAPAPTTQPVITPLVQPDATVQHSPTPIPTPIPVPLAANPRESTIRPVGPLPRGAGCARIGVARAIARWGSAPDDPAGPTRTRVRADSCGTRRRCAASGGDQCATP